MNNLDKIIQELDGEILIADGFDEAVIGYVHNDNRLVYSVTKCIDILCTEHDMTIEDAVDYFEFNVCGAYVGENTPLWIDLP